MAKHGILQKVMQEFKKQNLDVKQKEEIEAWLIYLDQQKFGEKLNKQILEEAAEYIDGQITIIVLIKEKFPEPEWYIEDNT